MVAKLMLNGYAIAIFLVTILNAKKFLEKNVETPVRPIQNVPTFAILMTITIVI
jgi:hypothetical protein